MAIIKHSSKFDDTPGHYKAYTEDGMILFRIVRADGERSYTVMTATAGEDDGTLAIRQPRAQGSSSRFAFHNADCARKIWNLER